MRTATPHAPGEIGQMEPDGPYGYTWDSITYTNFREQQTHWPLDEIDPKVILDIGANQGFCSWDYGRRWPTARIYGVEMHWESACIAATNIGDRGCVFNVAVAGSTGERFYNGDMHTVFHLTESGNIVEAVTLLEICEEIDQPIHFAKMDIEGAEWEVLSAPGWEEWIATLLIEEHPQYHTYQTDDLIDLLVDRGYWVSGERGMIWAVRAD